ncbi:MAG: hypothetical protein RR334_00670 [Clostridia bacterium]
MEKFNDDFLSKSNYAKLKKLSSNCDYLNFPTVNDNRLNVTFETNKTYGYAPVITNTCSYDGYIELISKVFNAVESKVGTEQAIILTNKIVKEAVAVAHPINFKVSALGEPSSTLTLKSILDMALVSPDGKISEVNKLRASQLPNLKKARKNDDSYPCFLFNDDKISAFMKNGQVLLALTHITAQSADGFLSALEYMGKNNNIDNQEISNLINILLSLNNCDNEIYDRNISYYERNKIAASVGSDLFNLDIQIAESPKKTTKIIEKSDNQIILPKFKIPETLKIILPKEPECYQESFFDDMPASPSVICKVSISSASNKSVLLSPNNNHGFDIEAQDGDSLEIETFSK